MLQVQIAMSFENLPHSCIQSNPVKLSELTYTNFDTVISCDVVYDLIRLIMQLESGNLFVLSVVDYYVILVSLFTPFKVILSLPSVQVSPDMILWLTGSPRSRGADTQAALITQATPSSGNRIVLRRQEMVDVFINFLKFPISATIRKSITGI